MFKTLAHARYQIFFAVGANISSTWNWLRPMAVWCLKPLVRDTHCHLSYNRSVKTAVGN